jgi:hypothetical protein
VARKAVSERALIQRINRKLKQDGDQLRRGRGASVAQSIGAYYVFDLQRTALVAQHVNLEIRPRIRRSPGLGGTPDIQPLHRLAYMSPRDSSEQ